MKDNKTIVYQNHIAAQPLTKKYLLALLLNKTSQTLLKIPPYSLQRTHRCKNAQLTVTDNSGKTVKQIALNTGTGVINIDASAFSSGTYNYTLLIDGKISESKKR